MFVKISLCRNNSKSQFAEKRTNNSGDHLASAGYHMRKMGYHVPAAIYSFTSYQIGKLSRKAKAFKNA